MPSVDDLLRQAFEPRDDEWVRRSPAAHAQVVARHRRQLVVRRGATVAALAGVAAAAVLALGGQLDGPSRSVDPAGPSTTGTTLTDGVTPLEGTWTSGPLARADVRAAARATGTPGVVATMMQDLPAVPFRVVVVVHGANLETSVEGLDGKQEVLDKESISVSGDLATVRPYALSAHTEHRWTIDGDSLTFDFRSTNEPENDLGVPGEAWQRLLYDTSTFTRAQ